MSVAWYATTTSSWCTHALFPSPECHITMHRGTRVLEVAQTLILREVDACCCARRTIRMYDSRRVATGYCRSGEYRKVHPNQALRRVTFDVHVCVFFFFQAEDGIRDVAVTGVQTCALPIFGSPGGGPRARSGSASYRPRPRAWCGTGCSRWRVVGSS